MENSIKSIKKLLHDTFSIEALEIIDESIHHRHHRAIRDNTEALTHLYIRIHTPDLLGLSRVTQHRTIYKALQPAIDNGLHAVRIEII